MFSNSLFRLINSIILFNFQWYVKEKSSKSSHCEGETSECFDDKCLIDLIHLSSQKCKTLACTSCLHVRICSFCFFMSLYNTYFEFLITWLNKTCNLRGWFRLAFFTIFRYFVDYRVDWWKKNNQQMTRSWVAAFFLSTDYLIKVPVILALQVIVALYFSSDI